MFALAKFNKKLMSDFFQQNRAKLPTFSLYVIVHGKQPAPFLFLRLVEWFRSFNGQVTHMKSLQGSSLGSKWNMYVLMIMPLEVHLCNTWTLAPSEQI